MSDRKFDQFYIPLPENKEIIVVGENGLPMAHQGPERRNPVSREMSRLRGCTQEYLARRGFHFIGGPLGRNENLPLPDQFKEISARDLGELGESLQALFAMQDINDLIGIFRSQVDIAAHAKALRLAHEGCRIAFAMDEDGFFYASY